MTIIQVPDEKPAARTPPTTARTTSTVGSKGHRVVPGDARVDPSFVNTNAFNAVFQDLVSRCAWHGAVRQGAVRPGGMVAIAESAMPLT